MVTTKNCNLCQVTKPLSDFTPRPDRPLGVYGRCKQCKNTARSIRYKDRKRNSPVELWASVATNNAKFRASHANILASITVSDVTQELERLGSCCAYCKRKLGFQGTSSNRLASPSIDRIVPGQGYTRTNITIACYRCNAIKNDATPEELETIAKSVRKLLTERSL